MGSEVQDRGPLDGVRVLDLSRVLAGPLCTMTLGDLGADVIKVERPGIGDETREWGPPWVEGPEGRESAYYLSVNRNKRSVTADFHSAEDIALLRRLAAGADVVVENFAPGSLARFGLDYESLSADNERLVYCSITGYGTGGSEAWRPGYDFAIQARTGWMAMNGAPDSEPVKVGVAVVDVLTGQNAVIAILAALHERQRSGRGQHVSVALMDSGLAGLINVAQAALSGVPAKRFGNTHATIVPYQTFATADETIVIAVGNDEQWRRFCRATELEPLAHDERFATNPQRVVNRLELTDLISGRLRERTAEEWLATFDAAGVPCAPVQRVEQAVRDPAVLERKGLWHLEGRTYGPLDTVASPLRLGRTPATPRRPPPTLGEHADEIRAGGWE
jgi:crotonobetainyl-CoA:carnitine CoA-transferase CaiB-like acyl-CoA transferase